jgi:alcohol dehydrogenase class IV
VEIESMLVRGELELRKFFAPEFIFGCGALELAGRYARNFGLRKVLIVTDAGVTRAGWAGRVCGSLDEAGISYEVFDRVSENPRSCEVAAGAEVYRAAECRGIVAVGGGSPMDCAKGIGIVSSNRRNILVFEGIDRVQLPGPPIICIPTTAGSSADVSQFAIITNEAERRKVAIISKTLVPDIALIDPLPLTTMNTTLTIDTGMDALSHAIEAYVSNASSPVTDLHALQAIRLQVSALPDALCAPGDLQTRYRTMLSSLHAGLAFSNASVGAVHAMSHSLGGLFDLTHGRSNALLLEHVVGYTTSRHLTGSTRSPGRWGSGLMDCPETSGGSLSPVPSVTSADRSASAKTLSGVGVEPDDLPELARRAFVDPCMATNPRRLKPEELEDLYAAAL